MLGGVGKPNGGRGTVIVVPPGPGTVTPLDGSCGAQPPPVLGADASADVAIGGTQTRPAKQSADVLQGLPTSAVPSVTHCAPNPTMAQRSPGLHSVSARQPAPTSPAVA